MDAARLPAPVLGKLALVGYWACPPDLRDRVVHWDGMDERDRDAAVNDLELIAAALAR